ncbi:MAG: glycosyltransferase [Gammaproteobacteria bacterium]
MRILVCTVSFPYFRENIYDARFVYSEVIGYAENGADVIVLTPHFPGSVKIEELHTRITIIRFPYFYPESLQVLKKPGIPIYDTGSLLALVQLPIMLFVFLLNIIRYAKHVDIIHAQWTPTALLALPAKWILKKKIILTARGSDIRILPRWLNKYIFRNVDGAIDCFGPTRWNLYIKSTFPSNYIKLPHLVYDDTCGNIPEEVNAVTDSNGKTFIILYVGRFHSIKITDNKLPLFDLIHAGRILKQNNVNFHIFYAGGGDYKIANQLETLITDYGLNTHVTLLGAKTNVLDYMHYCDLGVGGVAFNGVSQELTICKKPQLLMDTPENTNSPWRNNINCIFVKPENINDLADKLAWAQANPVTIRNMGYQAAIDMKCYFIESREGGYFYLDAFQKLVKQ